MSDVDIPAGVPFPEEIMAKIGYAHVFIPLLTEESSRRPWVNQEIGYAMALGVPIIPLAVGKLPEGMTDRLQARSLDRNLSNLAEVLSPKTIEIVVDRAKEPFRFVKGSFPVTSGFADQIHQRTQMLVNYAKSVLDLNHKGLVRQLVAFGSFSIPNRDPHDPDWKRRDGKHKRSPDLRELLRQEREYMERHAGAVGCALVLDPYVAHEVVDELGREAAIARLENLSGFLHSMPDDKVKVAIDRGQIEGSLFTVGDWFAAEAVVPYSGGGYVQTIFTRHAPTVMRLTQDFDRRLEGLLAKVRCDNRSSRVAAIGTINRILKALSRKRS